MRYRLTLFPGILLFIFFCNTPVSAQFTDITAAANIDHHHQGQAYGGGISCGDFNGDGYLDMYIPMGLNYANLLFLNNQEGGFIESAAQAGLADKSREGFGAITADIDNDGDLDIYLTNYFYENILFYNDGQGGFRDVTATAGVGDPGPSTGAAFADYNNDGYLDIYVGNRTQLVDEYASTLYRNNGDGTFSDVTDEAHVGDLGSTLAVGFFDYDRDGFQDLYVVNEFEFDGFYHNNGDGTFTNISEALNIPIGQGMGVDFTDYDNDGDLDCYVSNLLLDFLFRNNGDGTFDEVARQVGAYNDAPGWGVNFFDHDNDGDQDLYVVNGATYWPQIYRERNIFFLNNGDGTLTAATEHLGLDEYGDSRASACADFDNDGFVDLVFVNVLRGKSKLFQNRGGTYNWISIELEGTKSNRSGIGARIEIETDGRKQISEVRSGGSYASNHPLNVEFGLKNAELVDKITVYWPSGTVQELTDIPVNQFFKIKESTTITSIENQFDLSVPEEFALSQNFPNPFNAGTTFSLQIPEQAGAFEVAIYNLQGQKVVTLFNGTTGPGMTRLHWNGKNDAGSEVPSGVYIYSVKPENFNSIQRKLLLLK